jgi:hypothetical protein
MDEHNELRRCVGRGARNMLTGRYPFLPVPLSLRRFDVGDLLFRSYNLKNRLHLSEKFSPYSLQQFEVSSKDCGSAI